MPHLPPCIAQQRPGLGVGPLDFIFHLGAVYARGSPRGNHLLTGPVQLAPQPGDAVSPLFKVSPRCEDGNVSLVNHLLHLAKGISLHGLVVSRKSRGVVRPGSFRLAHAWRPVRRDVDAGQKRALSRPELSIALSHLVLDRLEVLLSQFQFFALGLQLDLLDLKLLPEPLQQVLHIVHPCLPPLGQFGPIESFDELTLQALHLVREHLHLPLSLLRLFVVVVPFCTE
mmetsp:Transcript_1279/g.3474  ORF Transcript_1279/g.3474 Transcript_1279/m.3474 type:complete len:227 (+) Transcript_1279:850-1530(+)